MIIKQSRGRGRYLSHAHKVHRSRYAIRVERLLDPEALWPDVIEAGVV